MAPGLSTVLAHHTAALFDEVTTIHLASVGSSGPECLRDLESSIALDSGVSERAELGNHSPQSPVVNWCGLRNHWARLSVSGAIEQCSNSWIELFQAQRISPFEWPRKELSEPFAIRSQHDAALKNNWAGYALK